jgi:hypothetical protein
MTQLLDGCPGCNQPLIASRFDATFRMPDGEERHCFGLPASLCESCKQLYLDPDLIDILNVPSGRCVFAIESDLVMQTQVWSQADFQPTDFQPTDFQPTDFQPTDYPPYR